MEKYPPTNIRLLCNVLEWTGLHCQPNTKNWRGFLLQLFCYAQHCFIVLFLCLRFLNTCTRSVHYIPEFYQMLVEDCALLFCYLKIQLLLYHRYSDIQSLTNLMENSFSNVDQKITTKCNVKAKMISMGFIFGALCIFITKFIEMYVPVSEQDLHIKKHLYENKFPSRKILLNIYIPYMDESEYWSNKVINIVEFYVIVLMVLTGFAMASLMPALIIQLEGQYQILNYYMEQIGKVHTDWKGKPVWYTDIQIADYVYIYVENSHQPSTSRPSKRERMMLRKQRILNQILYELSYVKQLVKFHQKLSKFQYKVSDRVPYFVHHNKIMALTIV
uniref:Odorant receptor n=1 Tax=Cacopsylla melanoneura TaxID=428564 RepID=A0A8D8TJR4_9HEMI